MKTSRLGLLLVVLLTMQSIAKEPYLITTYDNDIPHDPDAVVYLKFCPYDRQLLSCWLVRETRREDASPEYIDYEGYRHFHDITQLKQEWICECGHHWIEEWNNGACWCGWEPWS